MFKTFNPLKTIFLVSIFALSLTSINDPDAFTHLSIGREIIKNLGFPLTEPFNYTSLDKPFVSSEWFFAVALYLAYLISGSVGVVVLKAGVITLAYFILFKDSAEKGEEQKQAEIIAVTMLFFIAVFSRDRFVERPEILSNLFLVFTIYSLNQFFYNGKRYIYFIPLIFIIWANTHPSIIIGFIPFIAFICGGLIQKSFNNHESEQVKRLKTIALIFFISIICALINPYTYKILINPLELSANIWRHEVAELAPPDWQGYKPLYIFIGIIFISFLFNLRQSVIYIILVLPFIVLSVNAVRFIPLIGIVGGPIAARNISNFKFQISDLKLSALKMIACILIIVLTGLTIFNIWPFKNYERQFGISIDASNLPDGALEYLDKNNIQGRMFNTFHFGGYITFKGYPKMLTFIDGRGVGAMTDYLNAMGSQINWKHIEQKYNIDIAIIGYPALPPSFFDMEIDSAFPFNGWTLVYWDAASLVYLKNEVFKDVIERDGYRYIMPANGPMQFSKRLYDKKYQADVINELNRNIKTNPNPRAHLLLGFAYNETGEFDKAIESLKKVFEYKGMGFLSPFAHNGLGFSYLSKGGFNTALYHFKKSLSYVEDADILYNLGVAYSQVNDYKNAVHYLKKTIGIKNNYLPAYINLIEIYRRLGYKDELAEIENEYRQRLNASQSERHFNNAINLYIGKKLDEALKEFKKSAEVNPYNPASHANMGFIYYDMDNLESAKREFIIAIDIAKDWADAHYGLAIVNKKLGNKINAKKEFEEYLKINPRGFWARKAREEIGLIE